MSEIINHEEAYLLGCAKQGESNLARCYLDIKAQRDELLEALIDCRRTLEIANFTQELAVVNAAIAKAKGEV